MKKFTFVFLIVFFISLSTCTIRLQQLKDDATEGNYNSWGYLVSVKGKNKYQKKDVKGFKYVLYGKNLYQSRDFGQKIIYQVTQVKQGNSTDNCHIEPKTVYTFWTAALIYANKDCQDNNKLISDPTMLDKLKYNLVIYVGDYDKKLNVAQVVSKTPLIWFDADIHKTEIDYIKKTNFIQFYMDYPLSDYNSSEIGFKYNFLDVTAKKTLSTIKNVMDVVNKTTHLKIIPNLFTKEMIVAYYTETGNVTPTCAHNQKYYTSVECQNLTDLESEKYAIVEYVNQVCHSNIDYKSYMQYMEEFFTKCTASKTLSQNPQEFFFCGRNIRENYKYASRIQQCFVASFNNNYDLSLRPETLSNNLLDDYMTYVQKIRVKYEVKDQPKVYINSALFTHHLTPAVLQQQVCTTYQRYPVECQTNSLAWENIALLVIVLGYVVIVQIMYFVHFAKVVNRKASLVPFEEQNHIANDNTSENNDDLIK